MAKFQGNNIDGEIYLGWRYSPESHRKCELVYRESLKKTNLADWLKTVVDE